MNTLTRRQFLKTSGVVGAGALLAGGAVLSREDLLAHHGTASGAGGVLVLVTLYGGNDGLSMLAPFEDPAYHDARGELALAADEVLPLGAGLGLNAAMPGLAGLWNAGRLAIVRGVSYPDPQLSHFVSMDIWQTGSPSDPATTGWIGRWLDAEAADRGHDPLRAVAVGSTMPPFMAGAHENAAVVSPGRIALPTGTLGTAFGTLNAPGRSGLPASVATAGADLAAVVHTLGPTLDTLPTARVSSDGADSLTPQLDLVAAAIAAGVSTRVFGVDLGGFDTHANEKADQTALLKTLDGALTRFAGQVAGSARPVTTVVYSEFGRRPHANASDGTDHGTAGPVLVLGDRVQGGFVGDEPSLTQLVDGNLAVTTDFRDVYAAVLSDVLGSDPSDVLGRGRRPLPLLRT